MTLTALVTTKNNTRQEDLLFFDNRLRSLIIADSYYWLEVSIYRQLSPSVKGPERLALTLRAYFTQIREQLAQLNQGEGLYCPLDLSDEYHAGMLFRIESNGYFTQQVASQEGMLTGDTLTRLVKEDDDLVISSQSTPIPRDRLLQELEDSVQLVKVVPEEDVAWIHYCSAQLNR
jgi:hypothetical protein